MVTELKKKRVRYYLPDTNVLIYALAGQEPYAKELKDWITSRQLVLSSIVVAEFLSGVSKEEEGFFEQLLRFNPVLPADLAVARKAAAYKKAFSQKEKTVWLVDCLIAATCFVYEAALVTFDKKDYPMKDIIVFAD